MQSYPTFEFQNIQVEEVITESFEQCGLLGPEASALQKVSARRSLNLMFSDWVNMGLNLFTVKKGIIQLVMGQNTYSVPPGIVDMLEVNCVQITRQLDGIAASSAGGEPENCFDGDSSTGCLQTAPDGNISYNYGPLTQYQIYHVGIQTVENSIYTLVFEYSLDNENWVTVQETGPVTYTAQQAIYYALPNTAAANVWRIREVGGATLNISEIYLNIPTNSYFMNLLSRELYTSISNKPLQGGLGGYYLDRTKVPTLYLWPTPDLTFPFLTFNYVQDIPDVLKFTDTLYLPKRFMKAVTSGLAALISQKFFPEKYDMLANAADIAYQNASNEDAEKAKMHISADLTSYYY